MAVQFSETVNVVTTGGTPQLTITGGSATRYASYASGSTTNTLTFTYTVQSGDTMTPTASASPPTLLSLNGGTIKDASEPGRQSEPFRGRRQRQPQGGRQHSRRPARGRSERSPGGGARAPP